MEILYGTLIHWNLIFTTVYYLKIQNFTKFNPIWPGRGQFYPPLSFP